MKNRLACLIIALWSGVAFADRAIPGGGFGGGGFPGGGNRMAGAPAPPRMPAPPLGQMPEHLSKATVIELLEDDASWLARQTKSPAGENDVEGRGGHWGKDCYSGNASLKVAGVQVFRLQIPGWNYPIAAKPKLGQYRYLRFAWKKPQGDNGIMLQLGINNLDWGRYHSGTNIVGFQPSIGVAIERPQDWQVVTRDLYADFGFEFMLTGMAFTAMSDHALFDHIYLGRSIEELDQITNAAKAEPKSEQFTEAQLADLYKKIMSEDAAVRNPAIWKMACDRTNAVAYVKANYKTPDPAEMIRQIRQWVTDLDSPRYALREMASKKLDEHGPIATGYLFEAMRKPGASPELIERATKIFEKHHQNEQHPSDPNLRPMLSLMHLLEEINTPASGELLELVGTSRNNPSAIFEKTATQERLRSRQR